MEVEFPVNKLSIVLGSIQITLTSTSPIGWDVVSAIGNNLATQAKRGLDGFFGAVAYFPAPGGKAQAIAIGVGLATLF